MGIKFEIIEAEGKDTILEEIHNFAKNHDIVDTSYSTYYKNGGLVYSVLIVWRYEDLKPIMRAKPLGTK